MFAAATNRKKRKEQQRNTANVFNFFSFIFIYLWSLLKSILRFIYDR